jgi:hypothetical protein
VPKWPAAEGVIKPDEHPTIRIDDRLGNIDQPTKTIVRVMKNTDAGYQSETFTWLIVEKVNHLKLRADFEDARYFLSPGYCNWIKINPMCNAAVSIGGRIRKPAGSTSDTK